ncbi:DnaJ domain [Apiospora hydei]|uniref:DnaJ domain n=1 Tax=Apiospora hydei TaxID=1337664 RepID=A0ABR1WYM7_9PEZI
MSAGAPPNYYKILEVSDTANTQQIRDAYKKAALRTHPDRVPAESPERAQRTRKFQLVNDAYYTLSDPTRRREYDAQRRMYGFSAGGGGGGARSNAAPQGDSKYADPFDEYMFDEEIPTSGPGGAAGGMPGGFPFSWAWNYFTGAQQNGQNTQESRQRAENEQFGDVFEEMLREEGMAEQQNKGGKLWSVAGGVSGGILGFIMANFPGLMAGAVAGNRLGAVRDAKGKSVYAVFQELPQGDRAQLLAQLAAKVFSHTVGV